MKYGLLSLDFRHMPLAACFALARRYRFQGIEIFGCRKHLFYRDADEETLRRLAGLCEAYGVEIPMYTPNAIGLPVNLCAARDAEREDGVAYFTHAIRLAARAGIPRVLIVADHPGHEISKAMAIARFIESVRVLASVAERERVRIVIEPLTPAESPVVTTAADCRRIIDAAGSDAVYAMLDLAVPTVVQEPISNYFDILGDRMDYVHICDSDGKTDAHLRLGSGVLPMAAVFDILDRYAYDGYVTTELYSEGFRDPELLLAESARFLDALLLERGCKRT